jgi:hypothetical protein
MIIRAGYASEAQARRRKGDKEFYRILRDLECRLQELGERPDYGVPAEPAFATDTLLSAILYVTSLEDAKEGLLLGAGHDLIECDARRKVRISGDKKIPATR